jgi:DNA-binding NtrC family response regulator
MIEETRPLSEGAGEAEGAGAGDDRGAPRVSLLFYHRDGVESVQLREGAPVIVGRAPPADVAFPDPNLSRRHATFTLQDGAVTVEDLGSTNGTRLGGQPVTRAAFGPGDEVVMGGVTAVVHALAPRNGEAPPGIDGHDRFCQALEAEVVRARFWKRRVALVMLRGAGPRAHVRHWADRARARLRVVDRIGFYSDGALLLLLPEIGPDEALVLARALAAGDPPLLAGVSVFPDAAGSAEELLELCGAAVREATPADPACIAPPSAPRTWTLPAVADEDALVAESPAMRRLVETAARVARGAIPVLVLGETGTGKEVLARFLHEQGPRRDRPLVCVNCGAIAPTLVESTLFGHEKGAFTGAVQQQKGVFEAADGGTVFLDEIGELPPAAQAALLRVLETQRVTRVGSTREIQVSARVIAATHRDLEAMCDDGRFRQDLLYRLNAVTLRIPPLRDRLSDVPRLAARLLRLANAANGAAITGFDAEAKALLVAHDWPGNVRELKNAIERAVVIAQGDVITADDLPERLRAAPPEPGIPARPSGAPPPGAGRTPQEDFRTRMDRLESEVLTEALREADWNQSETARRLRMPLRTLVYKIRAHGIRKGAG